MFQFVINLPSGDRVFAGTLSGNLLTVKSESGKQLYEAEWDFTTHEIAVAEKDFPELWMKWAQQAIRNKLMPLEPTRRPGLFKDGCSVCGVTEITHPHTAIKDQYGNIMRSPGLPGEPDKLWISPPEKVEWLCCICDRLVCRNCVCTIDGNEIWHNTYCSEACRAAAPADDLAHDEQTSYATSK